MDTATSVLLELESFASGDGLVVQDHEHSSQDLRAIAMRAEDDLDTDLLTAIVSGSVQALTEMMARLTTTSPDNASARLTRVFMQALPGGSDDSLRTVVSTGLVDFTFEDEISGRTCVHEAVLSKRAFSIQLCLSAGADLTKTDVYGRTALHYLCLQSQDLDDLALLLLQNSAPVNVLDHNISAPLHYAIVQGSLRTVKLLLRYGADVNPKSETEYIPLSMACSRGHLGIADLLLLNGARMMSNSEGLLPLHLVARAGHANLCELLITHGAEIDARDRFSGWTPIFYAASEGHVKVLRQLIQSGGRVEVRDDDHHSPTYYAAWEGHNATLQVLLEAGGAFGNTESKVLLPKQKLPDVIGGKALPEDDGIPSLLLPPP